MKKKKFDKKLVLNKESIATLNSSALSNILGGVDKSWPNDCKTDPKGTCFETACVVGTGYGCQAC